MTYSCVEAGLLCNNPTGRNYGADWVLTAYGILFAEQEKDLLFHLARHEELPINLRNSPVMVLGDARIEFTTMVGDRPRFGFVLSQHCMRKFSKYAAPSTLSFVSAKNYLSLSFVAPNDGHRHDAYCKAHSVANG